MKYWLTIAVILAVASSIFTCHSNPAKFNQYYAQGEKLYVQHCSNCHQKNGMGLGLVYPPLHTSDYMNTSLDEVLCLIRFGKKGELVVNGKVYNQPMQGVPSLTDLEIAEIATYIYNTWSHSRGLIDVKTVEQSLANCSTALSK